MSQPFAEITESSLHTFYAECWQWDEPPAFGQLLCVEDAHYAQFSIVTHVTTKARDQHRMTTPLKMPPHQLQQEYPHIFKLLHTQFTGVVIGHFTHQNFVYQAPPFPAQLHSFIRPATHSEYEAVFAHEAYISMLFHTPHLDASLDELILAILRHKAYHNILTKTRINRIIDTYSVLINNDYRRLKVLLQRIERLKNAYLQ